MSPRYLEKLDPERQNIFKKLASFSDGFILAGGTAMMLQIGHRLSYYFDCFSQKPLSKNLLTKINMVFEQKAKPAINNSDLLLVTLNNKIDLHLVFHPYENLKTPVKTGSISLAHLDDLAANKANTIGRRGVWRDYVDLFFLLKWNLYTINDLISLAEKKFGNEFNTKLFLEQLVYFQDLDIVKTVFIKKSYKDGEMKSLLSGSVDAYLKKIL